MMVIYQEKGNILIKEYKLKQVIDASYMFCYRKLFNVYV